MELIKQSPKQSAIPVVSIRFPLFISVPLFVLTCIVSIIMCVILTTPHEIPNPFSDFEDLLSGDVRQAALKHGFICPRSGLNNDRRTESDQCVYHNTHKIFSGIYVWIYGNLMNEMSFSLRENTLKLGDVELLWGKPEIKIYCETLVAAWPSRSIMGFIIPSSTGHISHFSPLSMVTFTRSGLPRWQQLLTNDILHHCRSA